MQDKRLIECVRIREFLYNPVHPMYLDPKYKTAAWKEISEELNETLARCKKRWQNIRDLFRKYHAKEDAVQSGKASGTSHRRYRHWETLQFLLPYMQGRKMPPTTGDSQSLEDTCEEEREVTSESDENPNDCRVPAEQSVQPSPVEKNKEPNANQQSTQRWENILDKCDKIMRAFPEKGIGCSCRSLPATTTLDKYFLAVSATVAELNKKHQSIIKMKIAGIIAEYEQKELEGRR